MERRRFLILGGASVLGAHLSERLLDDGHEVIAVDDFTSGSFATIAHLRRRARFAFVEHDVTTKFDVKVDGVFHLAVPSSERACEADPTRAALICVMGTANALEVAAQHRARIVMTTSVERFGSGVRHAEDSALEAARKGHADVRIVRVATAYGPRTALDDGQIVTRLIVEALRGTDLVVSARDAERVERLTYVDDAVDALVQGMIDDGTARETVVPFVEATVEEIASAILDVVIGGARSSPSALDIGIERTVRAIEDRVAAIGPPERGFFGAPVRADVGT